jgi:hypothetical protein
VFETSYVKLNLEDLVDARLKVKEAFFKQEKNIDKIKNKTHIHQGKPVKTRNIFAVDSGFNRAYDTSFTVLKAAMVDEEMEVNSTESIYLFNVENYQTERLRRFLMQQTLYETLLKSVESGKADGSIVLVDGTITLTIFCPTLRDKTAYKKHFRTFYREVYTPLMDKCVERDIIILGFLKRTGSTYLAEYLNIKDTYDRYIMNSLLIEDGQFISPIPVIDTNATRNRIHHKYVTFYINLKNWKYRFELLNQQEAHYRECICNLLYIATDTHYGMNPIFSKADEYARVTKREANLKFNYVIHELPYDERTKLRLEARKRTHFGLKTNKSLMNGIRGSR